MADAHQCHRSCGPGSCGIVKKPVYRYLTTELVTKEKNTTLYVTRTKVGEVYKLYAKAYAVTPPIDAVFSVSTNSANDETHIVFQAAMKRDCGEYHQEPIFMANTTVPTKDDLWTWDIEMINPATNITPAKALRKPGLFYISDGDTLECLSYEETVVCVSSTKDTDGYPVIIRSKEQASKANSGYMYKFSYATPPPN
ncbi:uncharacterized protein LOC135812698 [Sycon ciliatum]|uniref:uncharacterized protein LOC135812698 n=1 Tax=Sycon ciliatum TaxID=27933 RepID=UPI0031F6AC2F